MSDDEWAYSAWLPKTKDHECWAHAEPLEFPDRFGDYYCSICGEHLNSKKKLDEPKQP